MRRFLFSILFLFVAGCGPSSWTETAAPDTAGTPEETLAQSAHSTPFLRAADGISVEYAVTADWGSGFGAELKLTNNGEDSDDVGAQLGLAGE